MKQTTRSALKQEYLLISTAAGMTLPPRGIVEPRSDAASTTIKSALKQQTKPATVQQRNSVMKQLTEIKTVQQLNSTRIEKNMSVQEVAPTGVYKATRVVSNAQCSKKGYQDSLSWRMVIKKRSITIIAGVNCDDYYVALRIENKDVAIAYENDSNMSGDFCLLYFRTPQNDNTAEMHVCNDVGSSVHIVTNIISCKMLKNHDDTITIAGMMSDEQR